MRFVKGHGTENDFVVLPDPEGARDLSPAAVAAICDRRAGIGADGVLRVVRAAAHPEARGMAEQAQWFMDYRNADGSVAEMCGNGIRVFVRYLVDAGLVGADGGGAVATRAGVLAVRVEPSGEVAADLGVPTWPDVGPVQVRAGGRSWSAVAVHLPNPHAVVTVDDPAEAGDLHQAPTVSPAAAFPAGTNVEFVASRGPRHVAMRVYERGVGETRSCGTGACAAVLVAARAAGDEGPVKYAVDVPGGRVRVRLRADGHVELAGPAVLVAEGELRPELLAGLWAAGDDLEHASSPGAGARW